MALGHLDLRRLVPGIGEDGGLWFYAAWFGN